MRTRTQYGKTGTEPAADRLTAALLAARDTLPHAANNRPPAPSTRRAAYLRNEIGAERMKPIHVLLEVIAADVADGVAVSEHLAMIDQLRADVEVMAVEQFTRKLDHPLPFLVQRESIRETLAQGKADVEQMRLTADPENVCAIKSYLAAVPKQRVATHALETVVRQQLALLSAQPRRVYGAGQGADLRVMR